ncbi:MAG: hypothetical protein H7274_09030 [Rhodoferax sp.]|nr:hypothetical protein [Rhodoferax sp.]
MAVAEGLYGDFSMASGVVFEPAYLFLAGFADSAPHRAPLQAVYIQ